MENSMEIPLKTWNKTTIWPSNPTTGHIPWENHNELFLPTFSWPLTHKRIRYSSDCVAEVHSLFLETGHRWSNNNRTDKIKLNQQYSIMTTDCPLIWKSRGGTLAFFFFLCIYNIISLAILPLSTTNKSSSKKDGSKFSLRAFRND